MSNSDRHPTKILIHAGFHKTGTTSLQSHIASHRDQLAEYAVFYVKADFPDVGQSARQFGFRPYFWRLKQFKLTFRQFLNALPSHKTLVISMEEFSGAIPGQKRPLRREVRTYRKAAVPLAKTIISELIAHFGPDTDITLLYSLREQQDWMKSVYGHLLRHRYGEKTYQQHQTGPLSSLDLAEEVEFIRQKIAPIPVKTFWLHEVEDRKHGPAAAIYDFLAIPQEVLDKIPKAKRHNLGPDPKTFDILFRENQKAAQSKLTSPQETNSYR